MWDPAPEAVPGSRPHAGLLRELLKVLWAFRRYIRDIKVSFYEVRLKIRVAFFCSFFLDVFYNVETRRYSFALIGPPGPIIRWDNAPHHPYIPTYPHHFHSENGKVRPSDLMGDPARDLPKVMTRVVEFVHERCFSNN